MMILMTAMMSTSPQSCVSNFMHPFVFVLLLKVLVPGLGAMGEFFVFVKVRGKVLEIVDLLREVLVTFDAMKTFASKASSSKFWKFPRFLLFSRERSRTRSRFFS